MTSNAFAAEIQNPAGRMVRYAGIYWAGAPVVRLLRYAGRGNVFRDLFISLVVTVFQTASQRVILARQMDGNAVSRDLRRKDVKSGRYV